MNPLTMSFGAFQVLVYVLAGFTGSMMVLAAILASQGHTDGPGGWDDEIILPDDPGGAGVDWDAELVALMAVVR